MAARRFSYTAKFKRNVIIFAEKNGNRSAGRNFSVSETNVRHWRRDRISIFDCKATRKSFAGPKAGKFPLVDREVLEFVRDTRKKSMPVTCKAMQIKARLVAKLCGISESQFKASRGWCDRFMRRFGLSLRRRTSICQKLPADFQEQLLSFQRYVIKHRKKTNYSLSQIGNADETPVYFDMPRNYTVNVKGAKEVKLRSTGYEKHRITVMLCVTADGKKLPAYIILTRKTIPKKEIFPSDVIVRAQGNGWMTSELMQDWIQFVWNKRPGAQHSHRNMLVYDAFSGHLTED